jgi:hypothetical protein
MEQVHSVGVLDSRLPVGVLHSLYTTTWWRGQHQCVRARNLMQAICCGRRAAANFWYLLRLGRLQYFISQFCNTKNLLRPQKKWLKISLSKNIPLQISALKTSMMYKFQKSSMVWVTERIVQISSLLTECFIELETPLENFIIMTSF